MLKKGMGLRESVEERVELRGGQMNGFEWVGLWCERRKKENKEERKNCECSVLPSKQQECSLLLVLGSLRELKGRSVEGRVY